MHWCVTLPPVLFFSHLWRWRWWNFPRLAGLWLLVYFLCFRLLCDVFDYRRWRCGGKQLVGGAGFLLAGGGTISFVYSFSYCSQESDASAMLVRLPWCRRGGAGVSASSWISWLGADGEVAGDGGYARRGLVVITGAEGVFGERLCVCSWSCRVQVFGVLTGWKGW